MGGKYESANTIMTDIMRQARRGRRVRPAPPQKLFGGLKISPQVKTGVKGRTYEKKKKQKRPFQSKEGSELQTFNVKGGKTFKRNIKGAWKVLGANTQHNVYGISICNRFQAYQGLNNAAGQDGSVKINGALALGTQWTGNYVGDGQCVLPLVLWNLSAAPNIFSAGNQLSSGINYPNLAAVLTRTSANGPYTFGMSAPSQIYRGGGPYQGAVPNSTDMLDAFAAKILMYGTTSRAVQFRFDLVQFTRDYLHPEFLINQGGGASVPGTGNTGTLPDIDNRSSQEFFSELTRAYTYNPATFHNGNALKGKMKILKSWTHLIQPKQTTDTPTTTETTAGNVTTKGTAVIPHTQSFNIYHKLNRTQRYNWIDNSTNSEPVTDAVADAPTSQIGVNKNDVAYKARVYLMVRALATEPTIKGIWSSDLTPSYDISLKTYHSNFD